MKISLVAILFLVSQGLAAELFKAPEQWIQFELPAPGKDVISAEGYARADSAIKVTVVRTPAISSTKGAASLLHGWISSMAEAGYSHARTDEIEVNGYQSRHLTGEIRSPDYKGAILLDSFVIFSDTSTTNVTIGVDDAFGGRELGDGLLKLVTISGTPVVLAKETESVVRQQGEDPLKRQGRYAAYVVQVLIVIGFVVYFARNAKSRRLPLQPDRGPDKTQK